MRVIASKFHAGAETGRGELIATWTCLVLTGAAFGLAILELTAPVAQHPSVHLLWQGTLLLAVVGSLIYGSFVYQVTRIGCLRRQSAHRPETHEELARQFTAADAPSVCVLIPSYREEPRVVLQTVLSAVLADYPNRRVVVLFDDPPADARNPLSALTQGRQMVRDLQDDVAALHLRIRQQREAFRTRTGHAAAHPDVEAERLALLYEACADTTERFGDPFRLSHSAAFGHADALFLARVIDVPAAQHRARAASLREAVVDLDVLMAEYDRLASLFSVEITCFERKAFANLSHQANKAMNLNSYIGLMGGHFRREAAPDGTCLVPCSAQEAELSVPEADYVLTLDADSMILNDYILRLANAMQQDKRLAVAQTPYSSFPGAPSVLERTAGATTDIQYFVHQGFTSLHATYWVGANALLRLSALRQIETKVEERGHAISVFIQDRTVIEDTGSTIDLVRCGWRLLNYPARLSYSATPPDFGSLVIQRRRWANGGLIILPDLVRLWLARGRHTIGSVEFIIRAHYLASPLLGNLAFLLFLLVPFDTAFATPWLPAAAIPYYALYTRDLYRAGYQRPVDIFRVYALNLLLIPVNLTGVAASIRQAVTGRKSAFGRTPKVDGRTGMGPGQVLLQFGMLALAGIGCLTNLITARYSYAAFTAFNTAFIAWGITTMIGWREAMQDLSPILPRWLRVAEPTLPLTQPVLQDDPAQAAPDRLVMASASSGPRGKTTAREPA
ncbi:MAG: glycosyltransferase family 2 protein [Acetobacteraceae bacterium]